MTRGIYEIHTNICISRNFFDVLEIAKRFIPNYISTCFNFLVQLNEPIRVSKIKESMNCTRMNPLTRISDLAIACETSIATQEGTPARYD